MTLEKAEVLDEISDVITDLQDAFSESLEKKGMALELYPGVRDGFFRSHLIRAGVKSSMLSRDYDMQKIANTGIEIRYQQFCIKVVRSSHKGDAPAPTTITRASWCMANQPRLHCDGITPNDIWDVGKLRLPGGDAKEIVRRVLEEQDDGFVHLLVDWWEVPDEGTVRLAISLPVGVWAPGDTPKVAWRYEVKDEGFGVDKFVPSDEPFNVFDDEDDDDIGMGVSVG